MCALVSSEGTKWYACLFQSIKAETEICQKRKRNRRIFLALFVALLLIPLLDFGNASVNITSMQVKSNEKRSFA